MTTDVIALIGVIDETIKFNIEEHLIRTERFGKEFSFLQIKEDLHQLYNSLNRIKTQELSIVPTGLILNLKTSLDQMLPVITRIAQYAPQGPNDGRHSLIGDFLEKNKGVIRDSMMILMYLQLFPGVENQNIDSGKKAFSAFLDNSRLEAKTHLDKVKKESQDQFDSVKESLAILTNKARELGVTKYSDVFKKQAETYSTSSYYWLVAVTIFFIAICLGAALVLYNPITRDGATDETLLVVNVIQIGLAKIIVASTLFYGLAVSVKNFRAYRHNEILNKHRQNALETFEAFSNSAVDTQTKSAVLVEATHSIFGHQITGFSTSDKDSDVSSKIIEILKPQITSSQGNSI